MDALGITFGESIKFEGWNLMNLIKDPAKLETLRHSFNCVGHREHLKFAAVLIWLRIQKQVRCVAFLKKYQPSESWLFT
jgi:hypothetical protein